MKFYRRKSPETRWKLVVTCKRLGLLEGMKVFVERQVSYWVHRIWFRYWSTEKEYPNQEWQDGNIIHFRRTAWYQSIDAIGQ